MARQRGFAVETSVISLDQVPRALAARDTRGLVKLVADADTGLLLGAQILAPERAHSIQTLVLALKHGMTAHALGETIFPYLTTRSEEHPPEIKSLMRTAYAAHCFTPKKLIPNTIQ